MNVRRQKLLAPRLSLFFTNFHRYFNSRHLVRFIYFPVWALPSIPSNINLMRAFYFGYCALSLSQSVLHGPKHLPFFRPKYLSIPYFRPTSEIFVCCNAVQCPRLHISVKVVPYPRPKRQTDTLFQTKKAKPIPYFSKRHIPIPLRHTSDVVQHHFFLFKIVNRCRRNL